MRKSVFQDYIGSRTCRKKLSFSVVCVKQKLRRVWSKAEENQANVHEVSRVEKFFKIIWYAILRVLRLEPEEEAISTFATDARNLSISAGGVRNSCEDCPLWAGRS